MSTTYIDQVAVDIYHRAEGMPPAGSGLPDDDDMTLYRIYAVLALTTGEQTTNEHVHDAWSAWCAATKPDHRSIVPFADLAPDVQDLDAPYRDAIRTVAAARTREEK